MEERSLKAGRKEKDLLRQVKPEGFGFSHNYFSSCPSLFFFFFFLLFWTAFNIGFSKTTALELQIPLTTSKISTLLSPLFTLAAISFVSFIKRAKNLASFAQLKQLKSWSPLPGVSAQVEHLESSNIKEDIVSKLL